MRRRKKGYKENVLSYKHQDSNSLNFCVTTDSKGRKLRTAFLNNLNIARDSHEWDFLFRHTQASMGGTPTLVRII